MSSKERAGKGGERMANDIITALAQFLFCGFLSLFILPQVVFRVFYYIPRTLSFVSQKKMAAKSILTPLKELVVWAALVAGLYLVAFLISPAVGMMLLASPMAIFCWVLGAVQIVFILMTSRRKEWQKLFYRTVYMKYATQQELDRYQAFIELVDTLTPEAAQTALKDGGQTYLEKEALRARARAGQQSRMGKLHMK